VAEDIEHHLFDELRSMLPPGVEITLPPRVFTELQGRVVDFVKHESVKMSFPAMEKFAGPAGVYQGGIITAAFDTAFGCLAFISTGHPVATIAIETTYIRPLMTGAETLTVEATMKAQSRSLAFLEGNAYDSGHKLVATAKSTFTILRPRSAK
jgi:uncharacterized protein (TIGR00369 family)